ncbi:hypothetical protein [Hungatella sp.]|uniref:hypothetical protein n=1 Tax=Hungatella sp. TaxID=2613924 RepID=UPI002A7F9B2F|nr:hypothetical protein [Hungatella sp.]
MNKHLIEATNLHTTACFLLDNIKEENLHLTEILNQLETGEHEPILYCCMKQIFIENHCEIFKLIESIESICKFDLNEDIKEELDSVNKELQILRDSCAELEEKITPYLFCPALHEREENN